jgi:peptide/nickel transport system permease protein
MSETLTSDVAASRVDGAGAPRPRRWWQGRLVIGGCFLVIAGVATMVVLGSAIAPYGPDAQNLGLTLASPSAAHWLGTDSLGRDVLSRVIAGARSACVGPLVIAGGSMIVGNALGLVSGYRGGVIDSVIMRWVDVMWSIPSLLVIIVVAGATGGGYWFSVALLTVLTIPFDTRIVRGATLEQVPRPYVEAARTLGVPDWRIMLFHIWPNVSPVAVANAFLDFAGSVGFLAGLSFLGLGAPPGTPDWGLMLAESQTDLFVNPMALLAPAAMIVITATAMNLIGDWLYERLSSRGAVR